MNLRKEKSQTRQKQQAVRPALWCKCPSDPGASGAREMGGQQHPQVETGAQGGEMQGLNPESLTLILGRNFGVLETILYIGRCKLASRASQGLLWTFLPGAGILKWAPRTFVSDPALSQMS